MVKAIGPDLPSQRRKIEIVKGIKNSICLVKPLDFERFKYIVHGILNGYLNLSGGNIIA
jgi:hypothetical protein